MGADPIRGETVRWTHEGFVWVRADEHSFGTDGTVTWNEAG